MMLWSARDVLYASSPTSIQRLDRVDVAALGVAMEICRYCYCALHNEGLQVRFRRRFPEGWSPGSGSADD